MPQRKRKVGGVRRRRRGAGWFDSIVSIGKKFLPFVKDNQLISKGADAFGFNKIGDVARTFGFGRGRRVRRRGAAIKAINY